MSGGLEIEKYRIFFRQDAYFSENGASGTPRDGSGEVSEANCLQPQMLLGKPGWLHRQGEQGMVSKQGYAKVLLQLNCPPHEAPPLLVDAPWFLGPCPLCPWF